MDDDGYSAIGIDFEEVWLLGIAICDTELHSIVRNIQLGEDGGGDTRCGHGHIVKYETHLTEMARLVGVELAQELIAILSLLIDGAYGQRRLFEKYHNGVSLKKAAKIAIDAYVAGFE